jgi:hypothetical protein
VQECFRLPLLLLLFCYWTNCRDGLDLIQPRIKKQQNLSITDFKGLYVPFFTTVKICYCQYIDLKFSLNKTGEYIHYSEILITLGSVIAGVFSCARKMASFTLLKLADILPSNIRMKEVGLG